MPNNELYCTLKSYFETTVAQKIISKVERNTLIETITEIPLQLIFASSQFKEKLKYLAHFKNKNASL